jgi:hypothetical protein
MWRAATFWIPPMKSGWSGNATPWLIVAAGRRSSDCKLDRLSAPAPLYAHDYLSKVQALVHGGFHNDLVSG